MTCQLDRMALTFDYRRLEKKPTEKNTDFLGYMLEGERRDIISVEEVAAQGQNLVYVVRSLIHSSRKTDAYTM